MKDFLFSYGWLCITLILIVGLSCDRNQDRLLQLNMIPDQGILITDQIQQSIDSCARYGGGVVYFPSGNYLTGAIRLKSNVTIQFEEGAVLQGSDNYLDYGEGKWSEGLITGDNLKNIAIVGKGVLDGVDCKNPSGEAGFRGPHCISLTNSDSIQIRDITIVRSANYAINCRKSSNGMVENVTIRGGHDALHTRFCSNFKVKNCDFRTGDDCFAGNDNMNFFIENCKINSSCNAFRFGCLNLTVKNCSIWGPGEYKHIKQNRNNTLSAFVHFSPKDDNPQIVSGNWLIQDVTIDHVDNVYNYNFKDGLWQTGKPATDITFQNLTATNVKKAFNIVGDSAKSLKLTIENATLSETENSDFILMRFEGRNMEVPAFFNANIFDKLELHNVTLKTNNPDLVIMVRSGNKLVLDNVMFKPENNTEPYFLDQINKIINK